MKWKFQATVSVERKPCSPLLLVFLTLSIQPGTRDLYLTPFGSFPPAWRGDDEPFSPKITECCSPSRVRYSVPQNCWWSRACYSHLAGRNIVFPSALVSGLFISTVVVVQGLITNKPTSTLLKKKSHQKKTKTKTLAGLKHI